MKPLKTFFPVFVLLLLGITSNVYSQGTTCGTATPIAIGACSGAVVISDLTQEGTTPAPTCIGAGVFKREGWFSFTTAGAQNISVSAISTTPTSNLLVQLLSGVCGAALTNIGCSNNITINANQSEVATTVIAAAGTYYIRIVNVGTVAVNMNISNVCVNATPINDDCAGATVLTPSASCIVGATTAGTLVGASQTLPGAPCSAPGNTTIQDVWYTFNASATSQFITVTPSGTLNAAFQVYSVSCGGTSINCTDVNGVGGAETNTVSGLTVGNQYWVRVYSSAIGIPATPTFTISVSTPPSNDDCAGAIILTPSVSCTPTAGCDYLATNSGIAACGTGVPDDDVWYSFVATGTSHTITLTPSPSFDPVLEVFSGACGGLASISCAGVGGAPGVVLNSGVIPTVSGTTYYIRVYDYANGNGSAGLPATTGFTICVLNPPPSNDGCAGADVITVGAAALAGDVASATQSLVGCSGNADDDVWYTFTTGAAGNYQVTVTGSASFDAVFEAFSTSCGGTSIICVNSTGVGGVEAYTLCSLTAGTQYWIRVYDAGAAYPATTTFTIGITNTVNNDCCSNATALAVNVTCTNTAGNLVNASPSPFAVICGGSAPTNDVFYSFTATATTHVVTVTPCATMNPVIQIYSSCAGASINCTNAGGNGVAEAAYLTGLTIGQTYYVRVYDFNGVSACTAFAICITTPPVNDNCSGVINLTPNTACTTTAGATGGATQSMAAGACGGNANDDVWYSFTAANATQTVTVVGCASFNAVVEAYTGPCATLTYITCVNATGAGGTETLSLTGLTPGTVYYIRIYDFGAGYPACNTFTICVVTPIPSDCGGAITTCTNTTNSQTPSGAGTNEIPAVGTTGNPNYVYGDGSLSPWGTDHAGCLLGGEINSTWILINILTTGTFEFIYGGGGTQAGFNDWIMYPYNCALIPGGTIAPVRCNWNQATTGGTGCVTTVPAGGNVGNYEPAVAVTAGQQFVICLTDWSGVSNTMNLTFGGTAQLTCNPLPIELLTFTGEKQKDGTNLLKWTTATETNNDHFVVKKSADASNWENLGTLEGAGNSTSELNYQMRDVNPINGLNYYRLIQVDYDGHWVPFNIVSVDNSSSEGDVFNIRPNPTSDNIDFDIFISQKGSIHIQILDYMGQVVGDEIQNVMDGNSTLNAKMSTLAKGIYSLKVTINQTGFVSVHKVIKS